MKKRCFEKNNKGFTIVELMMILAILAILMAIIVPTLVGYIDEARNKKYLSNAKVMYDAAQSMFTHQYSQNIDLPWGRAVVETTGQASKFGTTGYWKNDNGDQDLSGSQFAKDVLKLAGLPDGKPYCFMVAVGSSLDNIPNNTTSLDRYTVQYAFYIEEEGAKPWYFYNGEWTTKNPRFNNTDDIFTKQNVVKTTGKRLQYYMIINQTGRSLYTGGNNPEKNIWAWMRQME